MILGDGDREGIDRFRADYVDIPTWAEPLRMIAETLAEQTGEPGTVERNIRAGVKLVNMALTVDLAFAGELARLCGAAVWNDVRAVVGERFRTAYAIPDTNYRQHAVAAMLATGADDFCDVILPLLSGEDQQTRLSTYRLWPDIRLSSLGAGWSEQVHGWTEDARTDFVSELLHHRFDTEIASFAAEDSSGVGRYQPNFISFTAWCRREDPQPAHGQRHRCRLSRSVGHRPGGPLRRTAGTKHE